MIRGGDLGVISCGLQDLGPSGEGLGDPWVAYLPFGSTRAFLGSLGGVFGILGPPCGLLEA